MIQRGENLPFMTEAMQNFLCVYIGLYQLDGDALIESVIGAQSQVDVAHASGPNAMKNAEGPDSSSIPSVSNLLG